MKNDHFLFGKDIAVEDLGSGISRQFLGYNDSLMMLKIMFEAGAVGAAHKHFHSQSTYIESGVFDVTIDGVTQRQGAGDSYFIPPNLVHGAVCIEAGVLIDTFSPVREDFLQDGNKGYSDG